MAASRGGHGGIFPPVGGSAPHLPPLRRKKWPKSVIFGIFFYFCPLDNPTKIFLVPPLHLPGRLHLTLTFTLKFDGQLLGLSLYDPISIFIPEVVELILEMIYGLNLHNSCRKIVPSGNHSDREELASSAQTLLQCFLI